MVEPKPINPEFEQPGPPPVAPIRVEDIFGLFSSESTVPTTPARKLHEQIRIVAGVAYIYDIATTTWLPLAGGGGYPGRVNSGATAGSPFPDGWSVSSGGSGQYTITHNLGHALYVPVCTAVGTVSIPSIQSVNANTFVVWFYSIIGNPQSTDFTFVLLEQ